MFARVAAAKSMFAIALSPPGVTMPANCKGDAAVVTALEAEIDTHFFRLYAFTPAEIAR